MVLGKVGMAAASVAGTAMAINQTNKYHSSSASGGGGASSSMFMVTSARRPAGGAGSGARGFGSNWSAKHTDTIQQQNLWK